MYTSPEAYCTITQRHDLFSLSASIQVSETESESEINTPFNNSNNNLFQSVDSEKLTKDYCLMVSNIIGGGNV
jgi:hypothetical protein